VSSALSEVPPHYLTTYYFNPKALETHLKCLAEFKELLREVFLAVLEFRPADQRFEEKNKLLHHFQEQQTPFSQIYPKAVNTRYYLRLRVRLLRHVQIHLTEAIPVLQFLQDIVQVPQQSYHPHPLLTEADLSLPVTEECLNGMAPVCILIEEVCLRLKNILNSLNCELFLTVKDHPGVQTVCLDEWRLTPVYRSLPGLSTLLQELYVRFDTLCLQLLEDEQHILDQALVYEKQLFPEGHVWWKKE
jgi:hypothetical protein